MSLFNKGQFVLSSGRKSNLLINSFSLTSEDLDALAYHVCQKTKFRHAYGVPNGGLRFADFLNKHKKFAAEPIVIVDDVLTTGQSMEKFKNKLIQLVENEELGIPIIHGIVIFARERCPDWVTPIFTM